MSDEDKMEMQLLREGITTLAAKFDDLLKAQHEQAVLLARIEEDLKAFEKVHNAPAPSLDHVEGVEERVRRLEDRAWQLMLSAVGSLAAALAAFGVSAFQLVGRKAGLG